ncbi:protein phosphatase 2C domain-containing protein [Cryptosporangium phraense]|uniref:PPM-type phosphatase domain-containing protein n=1 Tax=Cryptosporangium phraense TaxID=2593070 RepID=A0A545AKN4_9ACTN|nr:protein phosphatase 2C domain-containing protein [Cryptosporangium phraense]TQS41874.1 hypothetical protein FL583_26680 [Cryptosporangium phraense]
MQITVASDPAPGHLNEDFVVVGPDWVVMLDGATPAAGVDSGCTHGVPWLVRRLAAALSGALVLRPEAGLSDVLADAILRTRDEHGDACDLDSPDSPSSTVAILRAGAASYDYLVLADSPVLVDVGEVEPVVINDERSAFLPDYSNATVRKARNHDGGFWVASTVPEAAAHALTGSVPRPDVRSAAVLTDGASRYTDVLGLGTWGDLLAHLRTDGPGSLIRAVRTAEREQLPPESRERSGRRRKGHDDATAAVVIP